MWKKIQLKDTIHNFVEAAVMGLGSTGLHEFLTASDPESNDKDVRS